MECAPSRQDKMTGVKMQTGKLNAIQRYHAMAAVLNNGVGSNLKSVSMVLWKRSTMPLSGMRSVGASLSACSRKGSGDMVSPSGTRGAGSTKVRAGRRKTMGREPELVTWPPLATFQDAP